MKPKVNSCLLLASRNRQSLYKKTRSVLHKVELKTSYRARQDFNHYTITPLELLHVPYIIYKLSTFLLFMTLLMCI